MTVFGLDTIAWALALVCLLAFIVPLYLAAQPSKHTPLPHEPEPEAEPGKSDDLVLHTTNEIKRHAHSCGRPECEASTSACSHYVALLSYLEDFLAKPHADVGRAGPVCPFVPLALKKQTLLMGMVRTPPSFTIDELAILIRRQRDRFLSMEPTSGRLKLYKAIVIGFPEIADEDAPALIDAVQQRLKGEFTQCGMMLGEFHRLNRTPGLRNAAFRPLQTPMPALAMRFMVPTDVLFLKHDRLYLEAYLSTIADTPSNAAYRAEAAEAMEVLTKESSE